MINIAGFVFIDVKIVFPKVKYKYELKKQRLLNGGNDLLNGKLNGYLLLNIGYWKL